MKTRRCASYVGGALCAAFFFFHSCKERRTVQRVQDLEKGVPHPTSIEELRRAVKLHEQRLERLHAVQDQVGVWYKMLALRYFDRKMYTHALDAFTQAITFAPENKHLFFYQALCAAYAAKYVAPIDPEKKMQQQAAYRALAVSAYVRALSLDAQYSHALYGLSVLYVFELNQPQNAVPHLQKLLELKENTEAALFVLARAYYTLGRYAQAIECYDRILVQSSDSHQRDRARQNKELVTNVSQRATRGDRG
ncbi:MULTISPECIES: tetratricopeptide repeat protein [Treponema]|nr:MULTISPECIES: tetratricopeptide repeat protein [Treponema]ANA42097.1 hypothetical protein A4W95_00261 [Treponema pallidum subsp. pallidum]AOF55346.1 hypothetical protein A8P23_01935 [Treponema pallidum subsp. pallidum]AOF56316.1 hypothetical protein A9Z46_01930 [Treponema pallidum subsp. pallidum]AOF57282.1 hypothetical protein A9D11_01935 [Treponema pallidum subsp. pallidum]AOF58259.1 hypothetical protein A9Z45_01935 [Treponema pallidum subsp. pallidum]